MTDRTTNWASNLLADGRTAPAPANATGRPPAPTSSPASPAPVIYQPGVPLPPQAVDASVTKKIAAEKAALARALLERRMKKRSRFTDADKAKIFGRFLQGENVEDIGASFGVSGMTIRKTIDEAIVEGGCELPQKKKRGKK